MFKAAFKKYLIESRFYLFDFLLDFGIAGCQLLFHTFFTIIVLSEGPLHDVHSKPPQFFVKSVHDFAKLSAINLFVAFADGSADLLH